MLTELCLVVIFTAALRLLPARLAPGGAGVDQWFWRAYIEALRRDRIFPPKLPQFRLDEAQWYPPLFPVLFAKLPVAAFERHSGQFAAAIDLIRLVLLMMATRWLSGSDTAALVAGGAYALTPLLTTYNMQLNPRGLGALWLDAAWVSVGAITMAETHPLFWLTMFLFGGLVLLTHKMTTQLLVFMSLVGAGFALDYRLALLVPGSMLTALLLSKGYYRYVLRAHVDILEFWFANWRWTGANPILESPIYGEPNFESATRFYRSGWRPWLRRLQFVVGFNPWMPAVLMIGVVAYIEGYLFSAVEIWVFLWLALCFAFSLISTIVPIFRCLGQGYLYGYNASFPAALGLGLTSSSLANSGLWRAIVSLTVLACLAGLAVFFWTLRHSRTLKVDANLNAAVARLTELPYGVVMCFPQHWHDVVAYKAKKPVLFGGHGYGFKHLSPIFPRLLESIPGLIEKHDVRYLLTYDGYCSGRFICDLPFATVEAFGEYRLYRFVQKAC